MLYPAHGTRDRQMEPSVKTLSQLSTKFRMHCVLSDGTQRRALLPYQSEKMEIYILLIFYIECIFSIGTSAYLILY